MFSAMGGSSDNSCPNCGRSGWENKKGFECPHCGFKEIESKTLSDSSLMFCEKCACHYSDGCPKHSTAFQIKIQFKKK